MVRQVIRRILYDTDKATPVCKLPGHPMLIGKSLLERLGDMSVPVFPVTMPGEVWWLFVGDTGRYFCACQRQIIPVSNRKAQRLEAEALKSWCMDDSYDIIA